MSLSRRTLLRYLNDYPFWKFHRHLSTGFYRPKLRVLAVGPCLSVTFVYLSRRLKISWNSFLGLVAPSF